MKRASMAPPESTVWEKKAVTQLCCVHEYLISAVISVAATKKRKLSTEKGEREKENVDYCIPLQKKSEGHISAHTWFFYITLYSLALAIFIIEERKRAGRGNYICTFWGFCSRTWRKAEMACAWRAASRAIV